MLKAVEPVGADFGVGRALRLLACVFAELRSRRYSRVDSFAASCVERAELVQQNVGRPAVADNVVTGDNESVELRFETEKTQANCLTADEIERFGGFFLLGVFE